MKLVHQINLAFGALLLIVLSLTGIIIHYVLMDHFVGKQKDDMQALGAAITKTISSDQGYTLSSSLAIASGVAVSVSGVEAIITDAQGNVLPDYGTGYTTAPSALLEAGSLADETSLQEIWDGRDSRYLVDIQPLPQGKLTLLTPMSQIKAIERALLERFLLVLCVAGVLVYAASLFITKKLIDPLMKLRGELKKVRSRQFSDVKRIKAGGEIGAVAETVHDLAVELDRYNRVQKQFIQNASHELKTPLMSIAGYAEGIKDGVFEGEGARKGLEVIMSESGRLSKIVTEMTLLAKLDSEEDIFKAEPVTLKEIVTETIERINPLLLDKAIKLKVEYEEDEMAGLRTIADKDKLLQALLNVVSNAARHARSEIRIKVRAVEARIWISIEDDGSGIAESLIPQLFHRFVRGKDGDTGLGLAISRAIVERCGGSIAAGNAKAGGAIISIQLPSAV
ncbi:sensor histidine kinase [Paenibacillus sp. 1011MAR3C5]|uniref:sensor histidine kinase n=1 Tax=Paenibacillus sp. 1011MAR3C5 TaxID=1675787 RepID=UPI000E6C9029|nr:HAMP domain-containing sensor histidine kinase [Paenibacillus sp. 1011MAR3C5]RJE89724.1 sensor histidine kinase [Paenibacillus sp. 1011MAR3C5]